MLFGIFDIKTMHLHALYLNRCKSEWVLKAAAKENIVTELFETAWEWENDGTFIFVKTRALKYMKTQSFLQIK